MMNIPAKPKYVDETFGALFIFGNRHNNYVDIMNYKQEDVCSLPKEVAEKVIEANKKYMEELHSILCNFPTPDKE